MYFLCGMLSAISCTADHQNNTNTFDLRLLNNVFTNIKSIVFWFRWKEKSFLSSIFFTENFYTRAFKGLINWIIKPKPFFNLYFVQQQIKRRFIIYFEMAYISVVSNFFTLSIKINIYWIVKNSINCGISYHLKKLNHKNRCKLL